MSKGEKAMNKKANANNFEKTFVDLLNEYGGEVFKVLEDSIKEATKEAEEELHNAGKFDGTKFRKGWKSKAESYGRFVEGVVYNSTQPQLTHLLEFGHATQKGGRTTAFNFISPVNDKVQSNIARIIERNLKK